MKYLLSSVLILVFFNALSTVKAEEKKYKFDEGTITFSHNQSLRLTLSKSCEPKSGEYSCDAYSALKKASFAKAMKQVSGSLNPGSVICKSITGGTVVLGLSEKGNENSFCRFKDGSMVDNGSLVYYGRKNDKRTIQQR